MSTIETGTQPKPRHAPYANVTIGHNVEVRAFKRMDGAFVCEAEYEGDTFGGRIDAEDLGEGVEETIAIDALVTQVCALVWNELLGTPVFRDDDDEFVGRVDVQRSWEQQTRRPTMGWIAGAIGEAEDAQPETPPPADTAVTEAQSLVEFKLSPDEIVALSHGQITEQIAARLLRARSSEELLHSCRKLFAQAAIGEGERYFDQAFMELDEVIRRYADQGAGPPES